MERIALPRLEAAFPEVAAQAAGILARGGLVIYPTETLYALGCDPRHGAALQSLSLLKRRPADLRLPLVAADRGQLERFARLPAGAARLLADRFWPGPLTLVLPRREDAPLAPWDWGPTLAVRIPGNPLSRALAAALGSPVTSTSANLSGEPPASDSAALHPQLLAGADLLLDAGALPRSLPSTLVQVSERSWRLLREGAVPLSDLVSLLGPPETGSISEPG
jgi:L-threonylcarbamoyladenylate synthase